MKRWCAFGLLVWGTSVVFSQNPPESSPVPASPAPIESSTADTASIKDLQTAGYYDLVAWTKRLKIASNGTATELRERIASRLGVTLPPVDKNAGGQTLTIDSAEEAGFITVDSPGKGKQLRLSGGIQVTFVDNEKKVTHVIKAGELWYDQEQDEMTALGNVEYTLIQESSREVFRGESLTFRITDSEGVFYGGSSTRQRAVQNRNLDFRYKGDSVRRSGGDVIVLQEGSITSSPADPPNYQIRAKKIWVLAPGEWGLQDAVLYVGRIPVFWFPFFFQPGDDFFFNPVLNVAGPGDRRGTSLQTTTYILGKKKKDTAPLSFLQLDDGKLGTDDKVIRGLYLVRGKKPESTPPADWTFKILADLYSNLGFLTGVDASFPNLGPFKTATGSFGLGLTRTVTPLGLTYATPLDAFLTPWEQSRWNSSYLFGTKTPFRWGGLFALDTGLWNLSWEYYSDPTFWGDLTNNRVETFSLFTLLGLNPAQNLSTPPTPKGNLQWKTGLVYSFPSSTTLGINASTNLGATFIWDKVDLPSGLKKNEYDPENSFYAPSQLVTPSLALTFNGDLWNTRQKPSSSVTTADKNSNELPLREPNHDSETATEAPEASRSNPAPSPVPIAIPDPFATEIKTPATQGSIPLSVPLDGVNSNATWNWAPSLRHETNFDKTQFVTQQQSDWRIKFSRLNLAQDLRLSSNLGADNSMWSVSQSVSMSQKYQSSYYYWLTGSESDLQTYKQPDSTNTSSLLLQTFSSTFKPLLAFDPLKESNLTYALTSRLWERKFVTDASSTTGSGQFKDFFWDGTPESVSNHQVAANLIWTIRANNPLWKYTSSLTNDLLPKPTNQVWSNQMDFSFPGVNATSKLTLRNVKDIWNADPWDSSAEWIPIENVSLKESFSFDLNKKQPSSSISSLRAFGFSVNYTHQQTLPYYFNSATTLWVQGTKDNSIPAGTSAFLPQQLAFAYQLNLPTIRSFDHRQEFSATVNSSLPVNLQQYTQMGFTLDYSLKFSIFNFLELGMKQSIKNDRAYRYFPALVDSLGVPGLQPIDFFSDLADSLKFWDDAALRRTGFKMTNLEFSLTHYLDDWVLTLDYSGSPQLTSTGTLQYQWTGVLKFLIQWYPVPELKSNFQWDRSGQFSVLKNQ